MRNRTQGLLVAIIWMLSGSVYANGQFQPVTPAVQLSVDNPEQMRSELEKMGVSYLWLMDGRDVQSDGKKLQIADFMNGTLAVTTVNTGVSVQSCRDAQFVLFERPRPDAHLGGFMTVLESAPLSKIAAREPFTVGAWVKMHPTMPVPKYPGIDPSYMPRGFMPLLSRTAPNLPTAAGGDEWIVQMTSEITYLNINRGTHGQNDSNQKIPWWADTYGTCYNVNSGPMGTSYVTDECWHFVSVSYNPIDHESKFLMVRRQGNNLPGHTSDFVQTLITSAQDDLSNVTSIAGSRLQIGANAGTGMHGIIRGLFFARKALSPEQAKAIANTTQPSRSSAMCAARDLKRVL